MGEWWWCLKTIKKSVNFCVNVSGCELKGSNSCIKVGDTRVLFVDFRANDIKFAVKGSEIRGCIECGRGGRDM